MKFQRWIVCSVAGFLALGCGALEDSLSSYDPSGANIPSGSTKESDESSGGMSSDDGGLVSSDAGDAGPEEPGGENPTDAATTDGAAMDAGGAEQVRVSGAVVLYGFDEGAGATVLDRSDALPALDLTIADVSAVSWVADGLRLDQSTVLATSTTADKVENACKASDEITLEAWVTPASASATGPARVMTLSDGTTSRNFLLGQGIATASAARWTGRLRTSDASVTDNGSPDLVSPSATATTGLQHLVLVRDSTGAEMLYIDAAVVTQGTRPGNFSNWQAFPLSLGNEVSMDRPWLGTFHLAAVYCDALTGAQVLQNYTAGI